MVEELILHIRTLLRQTFHERRYIHNRKFVVTFEVKDVDLK